MNVTEECNYHDPAENLKCWYFDKQVILATLPHEYTYRPYQDYDYVST